MKIQIDISEKWYKNLKRRMELADTDEIEEIIAKGVVVEDKAESEPFINKPCVSEKVCEHDKQMVLDKIRGEIEEQKKERCFDDDVMFVYRAGLNDAIYIIDKYKAESEEV